MPNCKKIVTSYEVYWQITSSSDQSFCMNSLNIQLPQKGVQVLEIDGARIWNQLNEFALLSLCKSERADNKNTKSNNSTNNWTNCTSYYEIVLCKL